MVQPHTITIWLESMKDVRTIMKKMLYSMMASIVFVVSFATFALAQDAMVGGTWNVTMNIPGSEPRKYPLVLKQEDRKSTRLNSSHG